MNRFVMLFIAVILAGLSPPALAQGPTPPRRTGGPTSPAPAVVPQDESPVQEEVNLAATLRKVCPAIAAPAPAAPGASAPPQSKALVAVEELQPKAGDKSADAPKRRAVATALLTAQRVCEVYGPAGGTQPHIELTAFTDEGLARAAKLIDPDMLAAVVDDAQRGLQPLASALQSLSEDDQKTLKAAGLSPIDLPGAQVSLLDMLGQPSLDFAAVALAGLAELIVERAKFEAVGWFLETLGEKLCDTNGDPSLTVLRREMSKHIAPRLCRLAKEKQLWAYGAGAALWTSLQTAVQRDLKGLPGAVAGLSTLTLLQKPIDAIGCDESSGPTCKFANELRQRTAARTLELIAGESAPVVLDRWSNDLGSLTPSGHNKDLLDGLRCAAAIPRLLERWRRAFGEKALDNDARPLVAAMLVELGREACAESLKTVLGSGTSSLDVVTGYARSAIAAKLTTCTNVANCSPVTDDAEKLSALIRVAKDPVYREARVLGDSARRFNEALARFDKAGASGSGGAAGPSIQPNITVSADAKPETVGAVVDALTMNLKGSGTNDKADAAFGLADASFDFAIAVAGFACWKPVRDRKDRLADLAREQEKQPRDEAAVKGLEAKVEGMNTQLKPFDDLVAGVNQLRKAVALGRVAAKGDFGALVTDALALLGEDAPSGWSLSKTAVGEHLRKHSKELASLVAIASAKDADGMARALDALADPPGGWRSKRLAKQSTLSVTAYAGLYSAMEWRSGPYGATVENLDTVYGQPPTLMLPFGLEYSRGLGPTSANFFFTVLDPAGYLGYDADSGKVTGASLLTALAPGVMGTFALGATPFNAGAFFMFRPGYRQLEPDATSFGAHALQLGLVLGVDATLFSFYSENDQ